MPILNSRVEAEGGGRAAALTHVGPRCQIALRPAEAQVQSLTKRGLPVPAPVTGWAMIDTGATFTCIDVEAAERAGLRTVDTGRITSATHEGEPTPIYACRLEFVGWDISLTKHRAYGARLAPQDLVALIGRDVLSQCVLIYNGADGAFSLAL